MNEVIEPSVSEQASLFEIPASRLRYWDVAKGAYVVAPGAYELQAGAASDDIRQTSAVTVTP